MAKASTDPIVLFEAKEAARLAGIAPSRLRSWHRKQFFSPQNRRANPDAEIALYDFRDLVGLRVVVRLRDDHLLSLHHLTDISKFLRRYADQPWGQLHLHLSGRELMFEDPQTGQLVSACPLGQTVNRRVVMSLKGFADDTRQAIVEYRKRKPGQIARSRGIQNNKAVIAGTRIPTSTIWSYHQEGFSFHQIRGEFPFLSDRDIAAAIEYEKQQRAA